MSGPDKRPSLSLHDAVKVLGWDRQWRAKYKALRKVRKPRQVQAEEVTAAENEYKKAVAFWQEKRKTIEARIARLQAALDEDGE